MSVRMFSAHHIDLSLLDVPSVYNSQSKGNDANSGHDIKHSVWNQGQATQKGIVSGNQIDEVKSHFRTSDAREREQEAIKLWLCKANSMKDDTRAKSCIQEPRKALTHPHSLQPGQMPS